MMWQINKYFLSLLFIVWAFFAPVSGQAQVHSGVITLAGYKQPDPVPTAATGTVKFTLKNDTLTISGEFTDLSSPYRGAGIHFGKKGEEGNRLFRLTPDLNEAKTSGRFPPSENRYKLSTTQQEYLMKGLFYINIYTAENNYGEIRGQLPAKSG